MLVYETPTTKLYRIIYDDFIIENGTIRTQRKKDKADFVDYAGYRDYLSGTVAALIRNGTDQRRRRHHHLLAACSSGYNSSACMVVAAEHGCRRTITLRTGRGGEAIPAGRSRRRWASSASSANVRSARRTALAPRSAS